MNTFTQQIVDKIILLEKYLPEGKMTFIITSDTKDELIESSKYFKAKYIKAENYLYFLMTIKHNLILKVKSKTL